MDSLKRKQRLNIIVVLIIILGFTAFSLRNPSASVRVHIEQEALWIDGPEATQYSVPLASIQNINFVSNPTYDDDSLRSHNVVYGRHSNNQWGEYHLCADITIPACLVVDSTGGTYVFNFEDLETTQWFYEEFLIYLEEYNL